MGFLLSFFFLPLIEMLCVLCLSVGDLIVGNATLTSLILRAGLYRTGCWGQSASLGISCCATWPGAGPWEEGLGSGPDGRWATLTQGGYDARNPDAIYGYGNEDTSSGQALPFLQQQAKAWAPGLPAGTQVVAFFSLCPLWLISGGWTVGG